MKSLKYVGPENKELVVPTCLLIQPDRQDFFNVNPAGQG